MIKHYINKYHNTEKVAITKQIDTLMNEYIDIRIKQAVVDACFTEMSTKQMTISDFIKKEA